MIAGHDVALGDGWWYDHDYYYDYEEHVDNYGWRARVILTNSQGIFRGRFYCLSRD